MAGPPAGRQKEDHAMKILLSTACLTLVLGMGAASACDWQKSTTASATPMPQPEQQASVQASPADPVLLAALDQAAKAENVVVSK
jgi:hypothetical protein